MDYIVMGVSGCGKSTVGKLLAEILDVEFLEGDTFHTADNISRMKSGIPLTDSDRSPWLRRLGETVGQYQRNQQAFVMTCSALKKSYRQQLCGHCGQLTFVYLKGSRSEIYKRMSERQHHFMDLSLIDSQFEALEEPDQHESSITVLIEQPVRQLVQQILQASQQMN